MFLAVSGWPTMMSVAADPAQLCRIEVVDKQNGWPVPLVRLHTTNDEVLVTDNAGVAAFGLPEFMGRETWLEVSGDGYELPKDGFGNRGVRFVPKPGGSLRIEVERKIIAKRLGRLTGAGLFAESQQFGQFKDWRESGVAGSDTVQMTEYKGRLFWTWGDTGVFNYPLGIFDTSSATTPLKPLKAFQPPVALAYDYFRNKAGGIRGVAPMAGPGPTWVSAYARLKDRNAKEHLVCMYAKIPEMLTPGELGLAEWSDADAKFVPILQIWKKSSAHPKPPELYPDGHPAFWKDGTGKEWLYFGGPPKFRCPATYEAWKNPAAWESVRQPDELEAADGSGKAAIAAGAIAWSGYRKRWVLIFQQKFGKPSAFGEIWYAEGKTPAGPWGKAVKVLSHENYTFYNPQIDFQLTPADSPVLLFEGTYTAEFADHAVKTPRYNYNQMLYRLDLDDPALAPAQLR